MSTSTNNSSYLERAKHWISTADDIDVEKIDSATSAVIRNLTKAKLSGNLPLVSDLTATVEFLKAELYSKVVESLKFNTGELQEAEFAEDEVAVESILNKIGTLNEILTKLKLNSKEVSTLNPDEHSELKIDNSQYTFNSSSLTDYDHTCGAHLSIEQKKIALSTIRTLPGIVKLSELVTSGKRSTLDHIQDNRKYL